MKTILEIFSMESIRNIDFRILMIFTGIFFILFFVSETIYYLFKPDAEYTRKLVHVATGVIAIFFPVYIKQPLDLLILCIAFWILLSTSKALGFFKSINAINRSSRGSILYPVVVIICYFLQYYLDNYIYFFIPILVLAFADPVAALIGNKLTYKSFSIFGNKKSLSGSFGFFVVAFLVSATSIYFFNKDSGPSLVWSSLAIAVFSTIGEAVSIKGYDNLLIPLSVLLVLFLFGF